MRTGGRRLGRRAAPAGRGDRRPARGPDRRSGRVHRRRNPIPALDAPVLALWAESLQACVLAREGRPGAGEFAHRVATQARAVQLDGAQALAVAALAVAAGGDQRPARIVIGDSANAEGVRGAMRLLTGKARAKAAAARPIPADPVGAPAVQSAASDVLTRQRTRRDSGLETRNDPARRRHQAQQWAAGAGAVLRWVRHRGRRHTCRPRPAPAAGQGTAAVVGPDPGPGRAPRASGGRPVAGGGPDHRNPPAAGGRVQCPAGARTGRVVRVGGGAAPGGCVPTRPPRGGHDRHPGVRTCSAGRAAGRVPRRHGSEHDGPGGSARPVPR